MFCNRDDWFSVKLTDVHTTRRNVSRKIDIMKHVFNAVVEKSIEKCMSTSYTKIKFMLWQQTTIMSIWTMTIILHSTDIYTHAHFLSIK